MISIHMARLRLSSNLALALLSNGNNGGFVVDLSVVVNPGVEFSAHHSPSTRSRIKGVPSSIFGHSLMDITAFRSIQDPGTLTCRKEPMSIHLSLCS
jgi:hypothetical protein